MSSIVLGTHISALADKEGGPTMYCSNSSLEERERFRFLFLFIKIMHTLGNCRKLRKYTKKGREGKINYSSIF